jgi:hydrogenase maturation factor HypF (carbamoyltransferase family)
LIIWWWPVVVGVEQMMAVVAALADSVQELRSVLPQAVSTQLQLAAAEVAGYILRALQHHLGRIPYSAQSLVQAVVVAVVMEARRMPQAQAAQAVEQAQIQQALRETLPLQVPHKGQTGVMVLLMQARMLVAAVAARVQQAQMQQIQTAVMAALAWPRPYLAVALLMLAEAVVAQ